MEYWSKSCVQKLRQEDLMYGSYVNEETEKQRNRS